MVEWLKCNVVSLIKGRLKKNGVYVTNPNNGPTASINISLNELPIVFHCEFHQEEFKRNTEQQFKKLVRIRRLMLADEMREAAKELTVIANKLSR